MNTLHKIYIIVSIVIFFLILGFLLNEKELNHMASLEIKEAKTKEEIDKLEIFKFKQKYKQIYPCANRRPFWKIIIILIK